MFDASSLDDARPTTSTCLMKLRLKLSSAGLASPVFKAHLFLIVRAQGKMLDAVWQPKCRIEFHILYLSLGLVFLLLYLNATVSVTTEARGATI